MPVREEYQKGIYDALNTSGTATVQIGIGAMKAGMLLNGGALLAMLALAGQVAGKTGCIPVGIQDLFSYAWLFVSGLIASALVFVTGYVYQGTTTVALRELANSCTDRTKPMSFVVPDTFKRNCAGFLLSIFIIATFMAFAWGAYGATDSLAGMKSGEQQNCSSNLQYVRSANL